MPTRVLVNTDAVQTLSNKTLSSPGINTPAIVGGTLDASTMIADAITALGIITKEQMEAFFQNFTTGDVKLSLKTVADAGWVLMNDTSIGDATSGATGRANADTSALYALIWNNIIDTWAPVVGGRGANAAADFAAHKAIALPKSLGRALAGYGVGTVVASGVNADVDVGSANSFTVPANVYKWNTGMAVVFSLASGTITGLVSGTTYYVIRTNATLIQLASSRANARDGVEINITAKSSPVWSLTHTYNSRVMGEAVGESEKGEVLAHTHDLASGTRAIGFAGSGGSEGYTTSINNNSQSTSTSSIGTTSPINNLQPTLFLNVMVKL